MSNELFIKIVLSLVSILGALITSVLIPYLKSKISDDNLEKLYSFISVAVRCAEQIYTKEQWQQKKLYVTDFIRNQLNRGLNVDLTMDEIDTIIEGIVNEIKYPNGKSEVLIDNEN